MQNNKSTTIITIISIIFYFITQSSAAHFEYYSGGFTGSTYNYSKDYYYTHGPFNDSGIDSTSFYVEGLSGVLQASTLSRASAYIATGNNGLGLMLRSVSMSISLDSYGYASCWAKISTENATTKGVFYKIAPDAGETIGDKVRLYFTGSLLIEPSGLIPSTQNGYLKGIGNMDHIAITLNQLPPVATIPDVSKEIWTTPNIDYSNQLYYGFDGNHFDVAIGDIVGLFRLQH